jgi:Zinc finger, C2H2 type
MDDHLNGMHNWNWNHRSDEKYCDATGYSVPCDNDSGEGYVDSLRQLNRIVERILPESSSPAVLLTRQKLELSSLKRPLTGDCSDSACNTSSKRQQNSRTSDVSFYNTVNKKPLLNLRVHCDSARDTLAIKRERGNDSLNDSAYETFFDDGSIENGDGNYNLREAVSPDGADTAYSPHSRISETGSKFPSPIAETAKAEETRCVDTTSKVCPVQHRENFRQNRCTLTVNKLQINKSKSKQEDGTVSAVGRKQSDFMIKGSTVSKKKEAGSFCGESSVDINKPVVSDDDMKPSKSCSSSHDEIYSSADDQLDTATCHSDWSPAEQLKNSKELACEDDCSDGIDSSVQASTSCVSRNYADKTHGNNRFLPGKIVIKTGVQDQQQSSREVSRVNGDEDLKSFTCPHCAYSASKKGQVRKHMSVHGIFLCAHCEFSCERAELLEEHRRVHHPGLCGRRLCKKCRILFPSSELDKHERQCSGEKQRWACPECGKEFKFLSVMKAHAHKWHPHDGDGDLMPSTTSVAKGGIMEDCEEVTDKQDSEGQEPNENQAAISVSKSTSVAVPSSTEKIYQCEECGKSFKTKWTLSNHAMLTHGANTPFCCDIDDCKGTPFRSDKELNCHRQNVHQLGPRKYECQHPGCTMQFAKYGHFKRHQSTHTGIKLHVLGMFFVSILFQVGI